MKLPQFTLQTLLLSVSVAAISLGGMIAWAQFAGPSPAYILLGIGFSTPFLVPFVFVAFAIGRKKLTVPMVVLFAVAEAIACGLACLVHRMG
jgi:hypothetical protein